ncbi:MAG: MATE family efflux transporter [Bacteroidetes bacterium]|nr:MAG: MATE family efflux transporter [Bacteroidota bacterium]
MAKALFKKSTLHLIWQALSGKEFEYTSGSINKAIFLLAVPMIFEMVMESLFAVVDVYFVAKVSVNAVATVGLTESVMMIIYSIGVGLSMATTAIISRRVGEKKFKRAGDAAFQSILIALVISVVLGLAGYLFAEDVLRLMGGKPELIAQGLGYTKVMYAFNFTAIFLFLLNAIFRGAGNPMLAMISLWIANGLNMLLDPLLIFGCGPIPAMGIEGAAIATNIGRGIGVLLQLYFLLKGIGTVKVGISNMLVRMKTIWEIVKISAGGIGQFLVESASWIFLVRIMAHFGEEALAGYTIAFRVIIFTLLPSWGMANAAATLVGQNLGAGQPERAEQSVWKTALYNTYFLLAVSIVFFIFAEPILGLFEQTAAVNEIGMSALKIICTGYIFFSYGMVIGQAFNGAGDTTTPLVISLIVFWLIQIPLAYLLAIEWYYGSNAVFASISICHSIYAILAMILFKRGKWKMTKV